MNEQQIQPEIQERFSELPEVVQKIILESGWEKTTRRIVEDNNLRIDQGAAIENEVMLTMFGFERPEKFKENILKEAKLSPEQADKITADINQNVFQLIKDKLILETTENETDFEETESLSVGSKTQPTSTPPKPYQSEEIMESREDILSEIEKQEDVVEQPAVNTPEMQPKTTFNQSIQEKPLTESEPAENDIISQNLEKPSVSKPQTDQLDPYREPIE